MFVPKELSHAAEFEWRRLLTVEFGRKGISNDSVVCVFACMYVCPPGPLPPVTLNYSAIPARIFLESLSLFPVILSLSRAHSVSPGNAHPWLLPLWQNVREDLTIVDELSHAADV